MDSKDALQHYRAYGLNIRSALPLLGLLPGDSDGSDMEVRLGPVSHHRQPVAVDDERSFWAQDDQACHILAGVGAFLVKEAREILIEAESGAPEELLRLSLLGPALALALHQKGLFVIHASAVAMGGQAVAFLGSFARGKSTMAAGLNSFGHSFLSDDVTAVKLDAKQPRVIPGYPLLKLWPDAARMLGSSPEELPRVHPDHEKRVVRVERAFASTPQPLRRLYVLSVAESVQIESLSPVQGFEEIMKHWYGTRFGPSYLEAIDLKDLFLSAGRLECEVPVMRLSRPATLADEPGLLRAIERKIQRDLNDEIDPLDSDPANSVAASETT